MMKEMLKRAGIEPHPTNHCLRAMLSDYNCEKRHIKSTTGNKSDQAVESYKERPSMEQQQKMSLALSDLILLVLPLQSRGFSAGERKQYPAADRSQTNFQIKRPGREVLLENNCSTSTTSVSHGDQRSFPQYFYNCSVNVHNDYTSR